MSSTKVAPMATESPPATVTPDIGRDSARTDDIQGPSRPAAVDHGPDPSVDAESPSHPPAADRGTDPSLEAENSAAADSGTDLGLEGLISVFIVLPHGQPKVQLTVPSHEQVNDIRLSIFDLPNALQYTCFHLEYNNTRLHDYVSLADIPDIGPEPEIYLLEDPYTEKDARIHVIRMRDLLGQPRDRADAVHGILPGLSILEDITESTDHLSGVDIVKDYNFSATPPLSTLLPPPRDPPPRTVKSIGLSAWNPPPCYHRQRGHLLYLAVTTNEGDQFQITSHTGGFYVNKSSNVKFDPSARPAAKGPPQAAHSLLSLIGLLSPSFASALEALVQYNRRREPLSTFQVTHALPVSPWAVPAISSPLCSHSPDLTRSQEACLIAGIDDAETLRDWNEEIQSAKELPKGSLQDKIFRERLMCKLHADYVDAATRAAVLAARGEISPLNPAESTETQIFVYNNIFFSFGADGAGTFAAEGGDEAARVATCKDVSGVRHINQLDIDGLHTSGSVLIDYLGKRIVAQSIVPGILKQRDPAENQIDYGAVDGKEVVASDDRFVPLFATMSRALRIKKHPVWDGKGKRVEMEASVETKGFLGTDGRKYALDLFRLTPLDISWVEDWPADSSKDEALKYPHRMALLRPEFIESYARHKIRERIVAAGQADQAGRAAARNETPPPADTATDSTETETETETATATETETEIETETATAAGAADPSCQAAAPPPAGERVEPVAATGANSLQPRATTGETGESGETGAVATADPVQPPDAPAGKVGEAISDAGSDQARASAGNTDQVSAADAGGSRTPPAEEPGPSPGETGKPPNGSTSSPTVATVAAAAVQNPAWMPYLAFNPDVFTGQMPQTEEEKKEMRRDEQDVRQACEYLRDSTIPNLIRDLSKSDISFPMDGPSLSHLLHKRGINIRYIGKLAALSDGPKLLCLQILCRQEMISRSFKHVAGARLRLLPLPLTAACIAHMLNCLLGFRLNDKPEAHIDETLKDLYPDADWSWAKLTPESVRELIRNETHRRYRYELEPDWHLTMRPVQLLRQICLYLGLQIQARDYVFDRFGPLVSNGTGNEASAGGVIGAIGAGTSDGKKKKKKSREESPKSSSPTAAAACTFSPDDIVNAVPVVKHSGPRSCLAEEALEAGRLSLANDQHKIGQELLLESLTLHEQIYGILHPEVARIYNSLSMLHFQLGEKDVAIELARKAVIVSERTLGVDSAETLLNYTNLSIFLLHSDDIKGALLYNRHALELWKIIYGPDHPDRVTAVNNAAVMLQHIKAYRESRLWFEESLRICENLHGKQSIPVAAHLFQLAQALALDDDSKGAVHRMKESYTLFLNHMGPDNPNTKEAEGWLEQLTHNAVVIAKRDKGLQTRQPLHFAASQGARSLPGARSLRGAAAVVAAELSRAADPATHAEISPKIDMRSIDELIKFIEGSDSQSKSKRRHGRGSAKRRADAADASS